MVCASGGSFSTRSYQAASFGAASSIQGPPVGFSFSTVQTKSQSSVSVGGSLVLE